MSRIGQAPIVVPDGVTVSVAAARVQVKGPKGELERAIPEGITVSQADGEVLVARNGESREVRALHGLVRSLINNMVIGVTQGFEKNLEIHGVGYRAAKQGNDIELAVGFSHPVRKPAPQ